MMPAERRALMVSGAILALLGATLCLLSDTIFSLIISRELKLSPDSESFKIWQNTPVPIYVEFYFYNWTNPEELRSEKPVLVQMGPYRFNERKEKVNITWNSNGTVTFRQVKRWYFDHENSNGTLSDNVTTLNVVALTAAHTVRDWNYFSKKSLSFALSSAKQSIHIRRNISELLFDGYSDPLIEIAKSMPAFAGVAVPFDKFGWFYQRNGTEWMDGVFNMDTGEDDISLLGKLQYWNYSPETEFYPGTCSMVNGSAGELFPPARTKDSRVVMFSPELCRSVSFGYAEETTVRGIQGYTYTGGADILDNGTLDSSNECFCNGECVPSGVINVTSCRYGAPGFISYPHFYLADPYFQSQTKGLMPDPNIHRFHITLEPNTGIPLDVAARLQINILIQPSSTIALYENVPRIFFPMLWFNQRATMTEELAAPLRLLLQVPSFSLVISICILTVGAVLLLLVACCSFRYDSQQKNDISASIDSGATKHLLITSTPDKLKNADIEIRHLQRDEERQRN